MQDILNKIMQLSNNMLKHAEAGEWEQVTGLEQQRDPLLKSLFYEDVKPEHVEAVRETVLQTLDIDKKLIGLTEANKQRLAEDIHLIASRRKASHAYTEAQRSP